MAGARWRLGGRFLLRPSLGDPFPEIVKGNFSLNFGESIPEGLVCLVVSRLLLFMGSALQAHGGLGIGIPLFGLFDRGRGLLLLRFSLLLRFLLVAFHGLNHFFFLRGFDFFRGFCRPGLPT
jgi:hypothetical protein